VLNARERLSQVTIDDEAVQALCAAALALGIDSLRASVFAVRVARAAAALAGSNTVEEEHTGVAARLVLAPRATRLQPAAPPENEAQDTPAENQEPPKNSDSDNKSEPPEPPSKPDAPDAENKDESNVDGDQEEAQDEDPGLPENLAELVLEAAQAAIPSGLLARLKMGQLHRAKTPTSGSAGALQKNALRGRPVGARKGEPRAGQRINVLETLRAAAPWQKLRQRQQAPLMVRYNALWCAKKISMSRAFANQGRPPRCLWSTLLAPLRSTVWPKPRAPLNCCWPTVMCGATVWRCLHSEVKQRS